MSVKMAELSHVELAAVQRIHWTEEINSKCFQFILFPNVFSVILFTTAIGTIFLQGDQINSKVRSA
jgi:hypothetical protein